MRFWRFPRVTPFALLIFVILLSACSSSAAGPPTDVVHDGNAVEELCDQSLDLDIFQIEPAGRIATLGEEFQLGTLGEPGAIDLANDLFSLNSSFCAVDIPQALGEALDEIDRLYNSGQESSADQLINELLAQVEDEVFSSIGHLKSAQLSLQQGGSKTRRTVRAYLAIAARAQYWGNNDRADDAIASGVAAYETWASVVIDSADLQQALTIAAESQLLGLFELGDEAIARASDLAENAMVQALTNFQPCTANEQEVRNLLRAVATAMLLGVETEEHDFMEKIDKWRDIKLRRKRGESVPECDTWQVKLTLDTTWESGNHNISWLGNFTVQDSGELDGFGEGNLTTHVEIICVDLSNGNEFISTTDVTGTFSFKVLGKHEISDNTEVFKFQFPAEVGFSGVDTCNPFDETAYLPKYVIEEINTSGGVEGYDIATDQIYMVIEAVDGATEIYETLIGPVTLTLKAPEVIE